MVESDRHPRELHLHLGGWAALEVVSPPSQAPPPPSLPWMLGLVQPASRPRLLSLNVML